VPQSQSWSTTTRTIVLLIMLAVLLWVAIAARELIGPLAIAALLAYVLSPVVKGISVRTHLSRSIVVSLVYLLFLLVFGLAAVLLAPQLPPLVTRLNDQVVEIIILIEEVVATPIVVFGTSYSLESAVANWPALAQSVSQPDLLINAFVATSENLAWILIVLVTTYYLLLDGDRLRDWVFRIVPDSYAADAQHLYVDINRIWRQYLQGQFRLMLFVGVLTGIGAAAVGLPGALAFGVLAGLLDIVMSVGPFVVMVIGAIVAYVAGSSYLPISNLWFAVLVAVIFSAINVVENIWLRPRIMGASVRLHPAIVFVAVIGSLTLAGILTALFIVPLIGSALVLGRYLYCKILDVNPWPVVEGGEDVALATAVSPLEPDVD
jgi:predicted PurR-regulated permease PerM